MKTVLVWSLAVDTSFNSVLTKKETFKSLPEKQPATDYEDEEDSPHEGMHGSIVQLTEHEKPVRVKKKPKIGFY
jgi:hypothetical protein